MSAKGDAGFDLNSDDSASESTRSSSPPLISPDSSRHGGHLPPEPETPSPRRFSSDSPFPTPPTSSSPPPASHREEPFKGLVFGVLPDQWEPEILLEAQRMIVLGGGKVRRPGGAVHPPPELLLLPLMYEQRIPGGSLIAPLPAGWHDLKFVVTPCVVSCRLLGRRIGYERPILLGLDPSIMTPAGPPITTSTTAMGHRHSAANLEEELTRVHDRHAAEIAALHGQLQRQQVELNRRTSPAALAEEITENLKGYLRVELERQIRAIDTDFWARTPTHNDSSNDVKGKENVLYRLSSLWRAPDTAERLGLTKAYEYDEPRTSSSTDQKSMSLEDKSAVLTADISVLLAQEESLFAEKEGRCHAVSPASLPHSAGATTRSIRRFFFPTQPSKRRASESDEPAPQAKRMKPRPYWYRIFG